MPSPDDCKHPLCTVQHPGAPTVRIAEERSGTTCIREEAL